MFLWNCVLEIVNNLLIRFLIAHLDFPTGNWGFSIAFHRIPIAYYMSILVASGCFRLLLGVIGHQLINVLGHPMEALGYMMAVLGDPMAWRHRLAMPKVRWGPRKWRKSRDRNQAMG
jgi:hypothetical protein